MAESPLQPSSSMIYDFNKLHNARRPYKIVSGAAFSPVPKGGSNCVLDSFYRFGSFEGAILGENALQGMALQPLA